MLKRLWAWLRQEAAAYLKKLTTPKPTPETPTTPTVPETPTTPTVPTTPTQPEAPSTPTQPETPSVPTTPTEPPVTPTPWPALGRPIKANYCGSKVNGETLFDIFLACFDASTRHAVYTQKRADGQTHIVVAAKGDYRGQYVFDWTRMPERLANLLTEILDNGFTPIVFLSSGDKGTGGDPGAYFASLLSALRTFHPHCLWVPGWEVVGPGGNWTSKQLSNALQIMHANLSGGEMWVHLVDNRITGASHPVEADDPWAGDELGFWRGHGGEYLAGLLYQTASGRELLEADTCEVGYTGERGYRHNLREALDRIPVGGHGWSRRRFCAFETVAEDYYRGGCADADVRRIANECRDLGVTEFGNGLPS